MGAHEKALRSADYAEPRTRQQPRTTRYQYVIIRLEIEARYVDLRATATIADTDARLVPFALQSAGTEQLDELLLRFAVCAHLRFVAQYSLAGVLSVVGVSPVGVVLDGDLHKLLDRHKLRATFPFDPPVLAGRHRLCRGLTEVTAHRADVLAEPAACTEQLESQVKGGDLFAEEKNVGGVFVHRAHEIDAKVEVFTVFVRHRREYGSVWHGPSPDVSLRTGLHVPSSSVGGTVGPTCGSDYSSASPSLRWAKR